MLIHTVRLKNMRAVEHPKTCAQWKIQHVPEPLQNLEIDEAKVWSFLKMLFIFTKVYMTHFYEFRNLHNIAMTKKHQNKHIFINGTVGCSKVR